MFDLDDTLISTDLLGESLLKFVKLNPLRLLTALWWLLQGRAVLKQKLAAAAPPNLDLLPLREEVVAFARSQAATGRPVYIATAANAGLAQRMVERLDFVTGVIGSDGAVNLKGRRKADALAKRFPDGFDYVGDSSADLAIWAVAAGAVFVGRSSGVRARLRRIHPSATVIPARRARLRDWISALRLHQWAKNALIFVPIFLGGAAASAAAWSGCLLGFLSMGCLASATYVVNDLIDLEDDRAHWSKSRRAFAAGILPISAGLAFIPLGLGAGLALGWLADGAPSLLAVIGYLVVTLSYSFRLKRAPIVDVMVLGGLFTLRVAIGVICAGVAWSTWLLVFSMFLFTSLSFVKRHIEIARLAAKGADRLSGRGYLASDGPVVLMFGVALSCAAVLIMVMYLIEEAFRADFYRTPGFLWVLPVGLALWLGRVWLLCGRGELHDDPVVFALRDRLSLILGAVLGLAVAAAALV